jgi:glutamate-1-semialdehyde 2,1-aminomutase
MINTIKFNSNYPCIDKSNELYERAQKLIPAFSQTIAKGPSQYVNGIAPKYLLRGKGSHVWDVDGNEYIDYNMGIGPLVLGYSYPKVDEAINRQLLDGITFSLMHPLEVEVAEVIREIIPNAESVRYSKTGADVTSAAIRLSRAYTGRDKVLCCGYHGWHDWYASTMQSTRGIPQAVKDLTFTFAYNDIDSFRRSIDRETAAVILEPTVFEEPKDDFLHKVAELCKEFQIVLIFDEMWTGFRMALGGAQEFFGVKADLATYSKAVANGMPISILTGKNEIMRLLDEGVFWATTFGGEALSLAAAKATLEELREKNVHEHLSQQGQKLKDGYNRIARDLAMTYTRAIGYPWRSLIQFDPNAGDPLLLKSLVQQEMIKRGILWSAFHNISFSHSDEDIKYTLCVYEDVLPILKHAVEHNRVRNEIKGIPVQPLLRKTQDFDTKPVKS